MSSIRITATRPDGTVVGRTVEIENTQRLESGLAKAFADVLGSRRAPRKAIEGQSPSEDCVTLHACEGPRAAPAEPPASAVDTTDVLACTIMLATGIGAALLHLLEPFPSTVAWTLAGAASTSFGLWCLLRD